MPRVKLPNNWRPRPYQLPLWSYLEEGGKRAIEIAHRRWGKDDVALHHAACSGIQRVGNYWHCLPEYEQGRKAIWNAVNSHTGLRRIDEAFPPEIRRRKDEQQMFIEMVNGSTWQVVGSDRYNATVGAGPAGIVYSEWALCNPSAWGYHRPMLEENGGWSLFITTPRGNNHAKSMLDYARGSPAWFADVSTVRDTGALTEAQMEEGLAEYIATYGADMGRAQFEQEYLCSFTAAILGAYFGGEMAKAEREGRFGAVPVDRDHPVHTAWDLGKAVNNPIWCFQVIKGQLRIVDFYRPEDDDIETWVAWLKERAYHGNDYVPHDILVTEWGSKRTRIEVLRELGRKPKRVAKVSVADGLQAGRIAINSAVFDAEKCSLGIEGLKAYRREWDDDLKTFRENPVKDWAEHIGSAWRYLGLAWKEEKPAPEPKAKPKELIYEAGPGGVRSNLTVREAVEAMVRRKKGQR